MHKLLQSSHHWLASARTVVHRASGVHSCGIWTQGRLLSPTLSTGRELCSASIPTNNDDRSSYQPNVFLTIGRNARNIPPDAIALNLRALLDSGKTDISFQELLQTLWSLKQVKNTPLVEEVIARFAPSVEALRDQSKYSRQDAARVHSNILQVLCNHKLSTAAFEYFGRAKDDMNSIHATILISGLHGRSHATQGEVERALRVLELLPEENRDVIVYSTLFRCFALAPLSMASELLDQALTLYESVKERGTGEHKLLYNPLLQLMAKANRYDSVTNLLQEMEKEAVKPTTATYNALALGAGHAGTLSKSCEWLRKSKKQAVEEFKLWIQFNTPEATLLHWVVINAAEVADVRLLQTIWKEYYPKVRGPENPARYASFLAHMLEAFIRAHAYEDSVQLAQQLPLDNKADKGWFIAAKAMVGRRDWQQLVSMDGRLLRENEMLQPESLALRIRAMTTATLLSLPDKDKAMTLYQNTMSRMFPVHRVETSAGFHRNLAATIEHLRLYQAVPQMLVWCQSCATEQPDEQTLGSAFDVLTRVIQTAAENNIPLESNDFGSNSWNEFVQVIQKMSPSTDVSSAVAISCRSQEEFDHYLTSHSENMQLPGLCRALRFASSDVVEHVLQRLSTAGVDLDRSASIQALLSVRAAETRDTGKVVEHYNKAMEAFPFDHYSVAHLIEALCVASEYDRAIDLVHQTVKLTAAHRESFYCSNSFGNRQLVCELVEELIKSKQGEKLQGALTKLAPIIKPMMKRNASFLMTLPSIKAGMAFWLHTLSEGRASSRSTKRNRHVVFSPALGVHLPEGNIQNEVTLALFEVLRTFGVDDAVLRELEQNTELRRVWLTLSSTEATLHEANLLVESQVLDALAKLKQT